MTTTTIENNILAKALEDHAKLQQSNNLTDEDSPHILIVGGSGTGKSRSIKNLPPENTLIFNPENKVLPFQDSAKFKGRKLGNFKTTAEIDKWFKLAKEDPSIKYIIFDSFTEWLELLMKEAKQINKGYDIYNYYNSIIASFLFELRRIKNKIVILTAIDELVKIEQPNGSVQNGRYLSVEGKVWIKKIESKFSLVLFTDTKVIQGSNPPRVEYKFRTQTDGITSAKSPEGLFAYEIDNDLAQVVKQVEKYFSLTSV